MSGAADTMSVCIQISCLNPLAHSHQLISPEHYWHRWPMWPCETRAKHSSTCLKVQSGGCGWLLLNTIFIKRTSGFNSLSWSCSTEGAFSWRPTEIRVCIFTIHLQSTPTSPHPGLSLTAEQTTGKEGGISQPSMSIDYFRNQKVSCNK